MTKKEKEMVATVILSLVDDIENAADEKEKIDASRRYGSYITQLKKIFIAKWELLQGDYSKIVEKPINEILGLACEMHKARIYKSYRI